MSEQYLYYFVDVSSIGKKFGHLEIRPGMPQNSQNLVITNKDRKDISIDCKFESKPWLDFEFEPLVLKDRKTIKLTVKTVSVYNVTYRWYYVTI